MDRRTLLLGALAGALAPSLLVAQPTDFPTKPVRMVVPFSAGALMDIIARQYAEQLSKHFGKQFIVENRPGAGGVTASRAVLDMPHDGHSMLFVSSGHSVNHHLHKLPYDSAHDFAGLALIVNSPSVIVVNKNHPANNLKEFLSISRTKGPQTYGSGGLASATHLAGEYLDFRTGIKSLHVPYKGVQEALTDMLGERLDFAFPPLALAEPYLKSGALKALAVTSNTRMAQLPNVKTVSEQGIPDYEYMITYGVVMPSDSPKLIMKALADQFLKIGEQSAIQERFRSQGLVPSRLVLGEFDQYLANEEVKLGKLMKQSGLSKL
jgi:tripartite-type tricarboxylate transporter receptor subunit TctC